jgi:hypothetical protein
VAHSWRKKKNDKYYRCMGMYVVWTWQARTSVLTSVDKTVRRFATHSAGGGQQPSQESSREVEGCGEDENCHSICIFRRLHLYANSFNDQFDSNSSCFSLVESIEKGIAEIAKFDGGASIIWIVLPLDLLSR